MVTPYFSKLYLYIVDITSSGCTTLSPYIVRLATPRVFSLPLSTSLELIYSLSFNSADSKYSCLLCVVVIASAVAFALENMVKLTVNASANTKTANACFKASTAFSITCFPF